MEKKEKDFVDFEVKVKERVTKKDVKEFGEKVESFSLANMNDEALAIVAKLAGISFEKAKNAQRAYAASTMVDSLDIVLEPSNHEKAAGGTVLDVFDPTESVDPYLMATPTLEEQLEQEERKILVARMLKSLPPREEKVLRLRFGLEDGTPRTLEQVGQIFGITRERTRQIEAKALTTLRKRIKLGIFGDII